MMKSCMLVLVFVLITVSCAAELFLIYGDAGDDGNTINVTSSTGETTKIFRVAASSIKGIAIDYKKDLIFVVDGIKIIKIHLLDNDGNQKISGTGELFVDPKASHFESVLIFLSDFKIQLHSSSDKATSLMVDPTTSKLYIGGVDYVFEMNCDGSNVTKVFLAPNRSAYMNHPILHKNRFYIEVSKLRNELNGVYQAAINPRALVNLTKANLILGERSIYAIAGDDTSSNLFYVENSYQIQSMQSVETKVSSPLPKPQVQVVLSNFGVTYNPRAIAVIGRNIFWSSYSGTLYYGKLNNNTNFLPLKKISVVKGGVRSVLQMAVFESSTAAVFNTCYWFVLVVVLTNFVYSVFLLRSPNQTLFKYWFDRQARSCNPTNYRYLINIEDF